MFLLQVYIGYIKEFALQFQRAADDVSGVSGEACCLTSQYPPPHLLFSSTPSFPHTGEEPSTLPYAHREEAPKFTQTGEIRPHAHTLSVAVWRLVRSSYSKGCGVVGFMIHVAESKFNDWMLRPYRPSPTDNWFVIGCQSLIGLNLLSH